jgi:hypothetical protein
MREHFRPKEEGIAKRGEVMKGRKRIVGFWIYGFTLIFFSISQAQIYQLTSPSQFIYPKTTLNFDDAPDQTYANNLYLSQGIRFSRDDDGQALLLNWQGLGRATISPPNVICTIAYYTSDHKYHYNYTTHLNVNFLQPTYEIGAFFGNDAPGFDFPNIMLSVFDQHSHLMGLYSVNTNMNTSVDQYIGLRSDVPFYSARFQNSGGTRCIALDDLSFSVVPEPATILLFGLAGLALRSEAKSPKGAEKTLNHHSPRGGN